MELHLQIMLQKIITVNIPKLNAKPCFKVCQSMLLLDSLWYYLGNWNLGSTLLYLCVHLFLINNIIIIDSAHRVTMDTSLLCLKHSLTPADL